MTLMRYLLAGVAAAYVPLAIVSASVAASVWAPWSFVVVVLLLARFVYGGSRDRSR
jgi:hypothetical protein